MKEYIINNGKKLKCGITTGTCAASASKASVLMLLKKEKIESVNIKIPEGIFIDVKIEDIEIKDNYTICSVKKYAGDDPDITDGIKIFAKAERINNDNIEVIAGKGIGRVTKKGLAVEPGKPAINPVPLKMIHDEVNNIRPLGFGVKIELSIPEGERLSKKTFNTKLGIIGGLSILGTSGLVKPMS